MLCQDLSNVAMLTLTSIHACNERMIRTCGSVSARLGLPGKLPSSVVAQITLMPRRWKSNLNACVECIEAALPKFSNNPPMLADIQVNVDYFCNFTAPYQAVSRQRLLDEGADLTNIYQSPIELFNMTLIDQEYKLHDPQPPPARKPNNWESLPASPQVVTCSGKLVLTCHGRLISESIADVLVESPACKSAGWLFTSCAEKYNELGSTAYDCLCNTWLSE